MLACSFSSIIVFRGQELLLKTVKVRHMVMPLTEKLGAAVLFRIVCQNPPSFGPGILRDGGDKFKKNYNLTF